ncbi:MAG: hypothetical protein E6831_03445 [Veillonella sp.]|nr:hypothetical protein [Veillonella sp.]
MKDIAKQIIKYWYSLECDTTTIYQQFVIKPYWKRTNSRVSTYVVPLPNDPYNYSITDEIKYFKDEKEYVLDDEHAVLLCVVKGTEILEAFIDKLEIEYPEKPYLGNVYSASFIVDADGYYKEGSLQIAPFIWVIYQMMFQPDVEFKDIKLDGYKSISWSLWALPCSVLAMFMAIVALRPRRFSLLKLIQCL